MLKNDCNWTSSRFAPSAIKLCSYFPTHWRDDFSSCRICHGSRTRALRIIIIQPYTFAYILGQANHIFFRRYDPHSANTAGVCLALEPVALLLLLGAPIRTAHFVYAYVVLFATLSLSIVAYRLSPFHPLAEYPGPAIGKVTKLWGCYIAWRGHRHLYCKKLHDTYGSYVRIGPNELSVIDAPAVTQILSFGGLDKGRYYDTGEYEYTPATIVSLTGEAHTARRRVWNRAMTSAAIREYDQLLVKRARQLVCRLDEQNGTLDLVHWFNLFALDLMGDLAFGGGFEMLHHGKDVEAVGARIQSFMKASAVTGQIPWIVSTLHLFPQVGRTIKHFNEFCQALAIQRARNGGKGTKDLWYHLADEAGLEKKKPTLEDSAAEGIVAVVAASDTTASVLSSVVWFLLCNPDYYTRVQSELDSVFADGDGLFDFAKHEQLEFMSACINETLRLHPPLPSGGSRQVKPNCGPRTIAGRVIPEGTSIFTPSHSVHRNPAYFSPHPDRFVPERWLPGSNFERHNTAMFIPFSLGPANCVGQKFARRELLTVLTVLFKAFRLSFVEGFDSEGWLMHRHDYFVVTRGPLRVNLARRDSVDLC
ncbi:high nitrogen upregulated cytochrome P450 monooxygenase 2 [Mycena filopes]|nr:high nitrogen upregulated cytochrome P450 monooxygenase 2 [Mycena filopes]